MMYYAWYQDWDYPIIAKANVPEGWLQALVCRGERMAYKLPPLHFVVPKRGEISDALVNHDGWPVFSPKLQRVIDGLTSDPIQYIDVIVSKGAEGERIPGYKLCNSLVSLEAINKDLSKIRYRKTTGGILGIDSLVLDEKQVGNHSLFRLREYVSFLFVREDLVAGIKKSGCTGMQFVPIDKFSV
jgi:hypothetical protein